MRYLVNRKNKTIAMTDNVQDRQAIKLFKCCHLWVSNIKIPDVPSNKSPFTGIFLLNLMLSLLAEDTGLCSLSDSVLNLHKNVHF